MSTWPLVQIVFDIFMALGLFVVIMRMSRAPKDDPRMSRGLQLLQSKISVIEDLSDRTEMQVNQLAALLESKAREVQAKVQLAEQTVHEIRVAMERSLDVAKIFQDKIPHQEIIERQNTIKYVQAARLAHQGSSVEEIVEQVGLPKGEVEFIAKVNREQLMFKEDQLPSWAQSGAFGTDGQTATPAPATSSQLSQGNTFNVSALGAMDVVGTQSAVAGLGFVESESTDSNHPDRLRAEMDLAERQRLVENLSRLQFEMQSLDQQLARENSKVDLTQAFDVPKVESASLTKLGEEFRKACEQAKEDESRSPFLTPLDQLTSLIPQVIGADLEGSIRQRAESIASKMSDALSSLAPPPEERGPRTESVPSEAPKPRDPVLARAQAAAKVQAALERGRASEAATQAPRQTGPSAADLDAARALARESAPNPVINSKSTSTTPPVIRKVQFPKIQDPQA